jgi:hypothetical protein
MGRSQGAGGSGTEGMVRAPDASVMADNPAPVELFPVMQQRDTVAAGLSADGCHCLREAAGVAVTCVAATKRDDTSRR